MKKSIIGMIAGAALLASGCEKQVDEVRGGAGKAGQEGREMIEKGGEKVEEGRHKLEGTGGGSEEGTQQPGMEGGTGGGGQVGGGDGGY